MTHSPPNGRVVKRLHLEPSPQVALPRTNSQIGFFRKWGISAGVWDMFPGIRYHHLSPGWLHSNSGHKLLYFKFVDGNTEAFDRCRRGTGLCVHFAVILFVSWRLFAVFTDCQHKAYVISKGGRLCLNAVLNSSSSVHRCLIANPGGKNLHTYCN